MNLQPFSKEQFESLLKVYSVPEEVNRDFAFLAHQELIEGANEFIKEHPEAPIRFINPVALVLYLFHEHFYMIGIHGSKDISLFEKKNDYRKRLVATVIDKYLSNEHLEVRLGSSRHYFPPLSSLRMYLNTINGLLGLFNKNEPETTLVLDLLTKSFGLATCIVDLLMDGYQTEAFATWRTLHETESIVTILAREDQKTTQSYLTHVRYALAYRGFFTDQKVNDEIFENIKKQMNEHGLKSKDMKKFIEYGWLFALTGNNSDSYKLNFRDGVQKKAGLESYHDTYEMSSEIAHSSPLLIYASKKQFFDISLVMVYESFFRIEKLFFERFLPLLEEKRRLPYQNMRAMYYPQLVFFHQAEKKRSS